GSVGIADPRLCCDLERVRHGAGDPAGQPHLDAAAGTDVVPDPVLAQLRRAQRRDRDDRPAGHHRLHDLPALFRLRPDHRSHQGTTATIDKWDIFEASFTGPSTGNPFIDVSFEAVFTQGSREVRVPGFYDGDGTYRVRFMPDHEGEWSYRTRSKTAALDGKSGSLHVCAPPPRPPRPVP